MRGSRVVGLSAGCAAVLAGVWLALPRMGSDLSAQVARADFFAAHGDALVDLRWYGGIHPLGYSLVSPPLMATLGVRVTGALALLGAAVAFAALLVRTGVPRPLLGSLVGVLTIAGNLVSGRVTYALGVAFGLAALLALTLPTSAPPTRRGDPDDPAGPGDPAGPDGADRPRGLSDPAGPGSQDGRSSASPVAQRGPRWALRSVLVVAGALAASAASPVAGLFVGLAGAALLLTRRYADGLLLGVAAALPLGVTGLLFGEGGWMNISRTDTVRAVLTSLLVAALVAYRPVRVGAVLSAAGVLVAALVHTPVGLNATRLVVMFALPLLAAAARPPRRLADRLPANLGGGTVGARAGNTPDRTESDGGVARGAVAGRGRRSRVVGAVTLTGLLVAVAWWQPPVVAADLRGIGDPTTERAFFDPLRDELDRRGLTGRVEVPPTRDYWEAAHLGGTPLARGWLRQADIARNPLFFTTVPGAAGTGVPLTADSYRAWLDENAVQYVAVPDAPLSWVGRAEAELVAGGLPYLTEVWADDRWRLYAVADPPPLVAAPGELLRQDGASVTFRTAGPGTVPVRVRHSRWLTASGGATVTADGDWTTVSVPRAGTYTLGS
ncbi:hypothetical protein GA0070614_1655 [Micromonospora coxensis]|uniref:Dolichyl-phosphate-mannose-protein mannosyltransferase n=1 Tax=Micromonospora coxensis TaxID=356852 RepID=A0A1C5HQV0_9ACTN|nr:hypothetical protein [Micromonospora coxensis]SCG48406.1 hypothetical protein GA0070614_1655 [Micromonospora coxensis]